MFYKFLENFFFLKLSQIGQLFITFIKVSFEYLHEILTLDLLLENFNEGGSGVNNPQNPVYVVCEWPLMMDHFIKRS